MDVVNDSFATSATLNSIEETPSPKVISPKIEWMVGQLAWARVGNFPFWPCMVTYDPTAGIYHKSNATNRSASMIIHVHYFGDGGRHSWVSENNMIQFTTLSDFLKLAQSLTIDKKKKDPKFAAAFIIKQGLKIKWHIAIQEAMKAQPLTIEKRVALFTVKVGVPKSENTKPLTINEKNSNKKKLSTEQDGPDVKCVKQDNGYNTEKVEEKLKLCRVELTRTKISHIINDKTIISKLNLDSLPSSSDQKGFSEDIDRKIYKSVKDDEFVFRIYYENNLILLEKDYPDIPKSTITTYLRKLWDRMDDEYLKKMCKNYDK
ncbi:zinc finger CW-type PWWP domain protein 1 [Solenopsis invicta]|uniref:zinc finger CW-type PWWP domain protein 1 n=1 Tax=Solenopsis invicta TaxID=13686 RepID=UPI00193D3D87|nr:zinc finger CW-type PWWP domain protein 1 [Solenopsis invicta]